MIGPKTLLAVVFAVVAAVSSASPRKRNQTAAAYEHYNQGLVLHQKGDLDGAIREFRDAIRIKPDDEKIHSALADCLTDKRDWDGAIAEYREAVRLKPYDPAAHVSLGDALTDKHDWDKAADEYREAIRLDQNYAAAHDGLGWVLENKGDLSGALKEYALAAELDPKPAGYEKDLERAEQKIKGAPGGPGRQKD